MNKLNKEDAIEKLYNQRGNLNELEKAEITKALDKKIIFKYKEISDKCLMYLKEGTIWLSNPKKFNDPFDCLFELDEDEFIKSLKSFPFNHSIMIDHVEILNNYKNNMLNSEFICCFSEINNNILMWSHYADNHKGICVAYSTEDLLKAARKHRKRITTILTPVYYSDEVEVLSCFSNENISKSAYSFQKKASCWSYEKEWRLMISKLFSKEKRTPFERNAFVEENGIELKGVYPKKIFLGVNISSNDEGKIIELARELKIDIYKAYRKQGKYEVKFKQLKL